MKTVTKILLFTILLLSFDNVLSQDTIYIEYDNKMTIRDTENEITLNFTLTNSDTKVNTFNFKVNNLFSDFETKKFNEISDNISLNEYNSLDLLSLKKLNSYNFCDLHIMFSDTEKIYLIKKTKDKILKYKITYWSTQRGWEAVNTN